MSDNYRFYIILALLSLGVLVSAQVTFSRDWSGGKRAGPVVFDCDQFARLCRHFLHDLERAMSPDLRKQRVELDLPTRYEDDV